MIKIIEEYNLNIFNEKIEWYQELGYTINIHKTREEILYNSVYTKMNDPCGSIEVHQNIYSATISHDTYKNDKMDLKKYCDCFILYDSQHLKIFKKDFEYICLDFHTKQKIKNRIWGNDVVALEVYPRENEVLDSIQQIHLFNSTYLTVNSIKKLMKGLKSDKQGIV